MSRQQTLSDMDIAFAQAASALAPTGVLRVALNLANTLVARRGADGEFHGRAIDIARAVAEGIDRPVTFTGFEGAAGMLAALEADACDIAFLAIDPTRTDVLHFSPAYLAIQATVAVTASAPHMTMSEVDRTDVRIASVKGAAFDLLLKRVIQHATIETCDSPTAAAAMFARGDADALAGIREVLETVVAGATGGRVIADEFATIQQAVGIRRDRAAAAGLLDSLVQRQLTAQAG